jgi:hypothetical protein
MVPAPSPSDPDEPASVDGGTSGEARVVLADFGLSRALTVQWLFVGTLGFAVSLSLFGALYAAVTGADPTLLVDLPGAGWWNGAASLLVFVLLTMGVVAPHEYVHGLAIRYCGGTPHYGVGLSHFVLPYAYATTSHEFSRNQFVGVALAPLVVLSGVGVAAMLVFEWGWLVVPLAANAGGAVGDVWMTLTVLAYPEHVRVTDHATGVRIVGRAGDRPHAHSPTTAVWDVFVGVAVATLGALLALGLFGPFVLDALGVDSLTVGDPETLWYLFAFESSPTEISYAVGPVVLAVGGALGLAYGLLRNYRRHARRE